MDSGDCELDSHILHYNFIFWSSGKDIVGCTGVRGMLVKCAFLPKVLHGL